MEGYIFALATSFLWGLDVVLVRKGSQSVEIIFGTVIYLVTMVALIIPIVLIAGPSGYPRAGFSPIFMFVLTGLIGVFLGRTSYNIAIREIGASRSATITGTAPAVAVIVAILFASETVRLNVMLGLGMISLGLYLITSSRGNVEKVD